MECTSYEGNLQPEDTRNETKRQLQSQLKFVILKLFVSRFLIMGAEESTLNRCMQNVQDLVIEGERSTLFQCVQNLQDLISEGESSGVGNFQNSNIELSKCKQKFENPIVGDFDLNSSEVYLIQDKKAVEEACKILECENILYIDCEGHYFGSPSSEIGIVQIATSESCCYLFDIKTFQNSLTHLKPILQSKKIKKVFHDCSGDIAALYNSGNIMVDHPIYDTQLTQQLLDEELTRESKVYSLSALYNHLLDRKFPKVNVKSTGTTNIWLNTRPLPEYALKYAALDVLTLPPIFQEQNRQNHIEYDQDYKDKIEKRRRSKIPGLCRSSSALTADMMTASNSASTSQTQQQSSGIGLGTVVAAGAAIAGGIILVNEINKANRRS